ncbi:hypothetical protein LPB86_15710 [Pedobacter sp. MC2016-14]|uniref:hypothetical protein n=1 Tax=Pedobacter sp. MC2016-14 TaxID=2897327 RepID=UPI001E3AA2C4|nr:hypothetical protein [Pedobacter sp. MC2016-14]MCD0489688.1 hypothetical protein [Pedobacter sp. MC2016-14]
MKSNKYSKPEVHHIFLNGIKFFQSALCQRLSEIKDIMNSKNFPDFAPSTRLIIDEAVQDMVTLINMQKKVAKLGDRYIRINRIDAVFLPQDFSSACKIEDEFNDPVAMQLAGEIFHSCFTEHYPERRNSAHFFAQAFLFLHRLKSFILFGEDRLSEDSGHQFLERINYKEDGSVDVDDLVLLPKKYSIGIFLASVLKSYHKSLYVSLV